MGNNNFVTKKDEYIISTKDYNAKKKIVRSNKGGYFIPKYPEDANYMIIFRLPALIIISLMIIPITYLANFNMITIIFSTLIVFVLLLLFRSIFKKRNKYLVKKGIMYHVVKGTYVGNFNLSHYNLVSTYVPEKLKDWLSAIIDSGENKSEAAKQYAQSIIKLAEEKEEKSKQYMYQKQLRIKEKEEKEKTRMESKWIDKMKENNFHIDNND